MELVRSALPRRERVVNQIPASFRKIRRGIHTETLTFLAGCLLPWPASQGQEIPRGPARLGSPRRLYGFVRGPEGCLCANGGCLRSGGQESVGPRERAT